MTSSTVRLSPHPASPPNSEFEVVVTLERTDQDLTLDYRITGDIGQLRIPTAVPAARADKLWQRLCCEAFVASNEGGYREYNFSPSGEWAHYRFTDYREGQSSPDCTAPVINTTANANEFVLDTTIELPPFKSARMGLCVVVEDIDGQLGYWALHHPSEQPDFHHPDSFTLLLDANL